MRREKIVGIVFMAVATVAMGLAIAAYVLLHTAAFNRYALNKIVTALQDASGARVDIKRMNIHWSALGLDFYGIDLYGEGAESQAPFLTAEHLHVGLKIVSILRRQINLREIILDRPVLDLRVNADGRSNVPHPSVRSGTRFSAGELFDMAVGHTRINSGKMYYRDQRVPLFADVRNLHAQIDFGTLSRAYKGKISYEQGNIAVSSFKPIQHDARLEFTANRSALTFTELTLKSGETHLTARGTVSNYGDPDIEARYDGAIFTSQLGEILETNTIPKGQVTTSGVFRYHPVPDHAFLQDAYVEGMLSSAQLVIHEEGSTPAVKSISGKYVMSGGDVRISDLKGEVLSGRLAANAQFRHLASRDSSSSLTVSLNGVSLRDVSDILPNRDYRRLHIVGTLNSRSEVRWSGSFQKVVAHSLIVIDSPRSSVTGAAVARSSEPIPLSGVLGVKYDGAAGTLSFGHSNLQTGSSRVNISGTISKHTSLDIQASTSDLQETLDLVSGAVEAVSPGTSEPRRFDLHGAATLGGHISGSLKAPQLRADLTATNLDVQGTRWRTFRGSVAVSPSFISVQNGYLGGAKQGEINFNGRIGLQGWSFTSASPVVVDMTATHLVMGDLMQAAGVHYPVSGMLSAKLSIQGSKNSPAGRGSVQIATGSAWNEPLNYVAADFQSAGKMISVNARIQAPAGSLTGKLNYGLDSQAYDGTVSVSGVKLEKIHAIEARNLGVTGSINATANGRGTLKEPQGEARLQIDNLNLRGQSISQMNAQLNVKSQNAQFHINSVIADGNVEAKGDVQLGNDYSTTASVDVRALPIGPLVASYVPGAQLQLQGQTEIHATLTGPLRHPDRIVAHLEIPTLNFAYGSTQLALAHALRADYGNGILTVQETEFKGTGTDISLRGTVPIKSAAPLDMNANGSVDLSVLQGFAADVKSSGRLELNMSAHGAFSQPKMQGTVTLANAAFSTSTAPIGVENMNGQLNISGNRIEIRKFVGSAGGGNISAQGFMLYGPQASVNVDVEAKSVRIRYPRGIRAVLDGNLKLAGSPQGSAITGQVVVNRLSFTQGFDLAEFMSQFSSSAPQGLSSPLEENAKLNISLKTSQDVNLASSKISMQGSADLNVVGTVANPVVLGRSTVASGEIFFMGNRYEIQSGTLEFVNPVETNPILNIYAKTTVNQYDITVNFVGPLDRLRTNFTSDPALSQSDIINLIAFGKTAEESASSPSQPAALGAESVLAQGVSSQLSGRIEKLAGLSQFSISPTLGNSQQNPGAQVAVQEHITGNILLTFSSDVTTTQGQTVQVQFKTSPQTSVTVLRDQNGGYAIDVRYHKQF